MGEIGADVRDVGDVGEDDRVDGFRIFRFPGRVLGWISSWTLVIGMSPYHPSTIPILTLSLRLGGRRTQHILLALHVIHRSRCTLLPSPHGRFKQQDLTRAELSP